MTERLAKLRENAWFCIAVICAVSFITTVLPVLIGGLHASGDLSVWLGFAREIRSAIDQGRYFPGWANDTLGYGSVGIRFYPPVGYYTAAIISLLVGDWYVTVCIYLFLWMCVGCVGIFLLVLEWSSAASALAAVVVYAFNPFHLAEIYQFTLYGEFAAGGLLPFCFLFATRICRGGKWADVFGFAACSAALVLTHIPTTLIGSASLLVFVALMIERQRLWRSILNLAVSSVIALAASAFYWVRLLGEVDWLAHAQPQYSAVLGGRENWFFPYVISAANAPDFFLPVLRSFDAMVLLTAALFIPLILLMASRREHPRGNRRAIVALTMVGFFGLFMLSYPSYFIWDRFVTLQQIQFPWRWLTVVSVVSVVVFVLASAAILRAEGIVRKATVIFLVGMAVLIVAYDVRKNFTFGNVVSKAGFESILEEGNNPAGSNFSVWWPVWARPNALLIADKVAAGGRSVEILKWNAEEREIIIGAGSERSVRIATFYYPHWKATVDGSVTDVSKDDAGAMTLSIHESPTFVSLRFEEPIFNRFCSILSGVSWIALGFAILFCYIRKRAETLDRDQRHD